MKTESMKAEAITKPAAEPVTTDWQVSGVISFTDSTLSKMSVVWLGLTIEEAQKKVDQTVRAEMRKKKVCGISIEAQSQSKNWYSLLRKAMLK